MPRSISQSPFAALCSALETILAGGERRGIVDDHAVGGDFRRSLARLRDAMQTHVWRAGGVNVTFDRIIRKYDADTRREGFHVLHDWDGKADHVNEQIIPI